MPNHKSSIKRARQEKTRREKNRYYAKTMRNALKEIRMAAGKDQKEIAKVISMIDRLVKRGQIHKNKAANLKSGLMKQAKKAS